MAEKTQKIGIFDSGLGGTTVLKEMIKSLPNEDYIYYGDNGNFPYGSGKTNCWSRSKREDRFIKTS